MEVQGKSGLSEAEVAMAERFVAKSSLEPLMQGTVAYYVARHEDQVVAVAGFYPIGYITNMTVAWIVVERKLIRGGLLREGLRLARRVLAEQPWETYAEIDPGAKASRKFAEALGFIHVGKEQGRLVYCWRN